MFAAPGCGGSPSPVCEGVNLGEIKNPYIDLAKYNGSVTFTGTYEGPRLVFRNARNTLVTFCNAEIISSHSEDALCIDGTAEVLVLEGKNWKMNGALTFWKDLHYVTVSGLQSDGAHTGIRFTSDVTSSNVVILNNVIKNTSHEGIYAGPSKATANMSSNLLVAGNTVENAGWECFQVANWTFEAYGNDFDECGMAEYRWQDHAVVFHFDANGYFHNNVVSRSAKPMRVQDCATVAFYEKPNNR